MPSDGGKEAVAPRTPPVPAKPTQAEEDAALRDKAHWLFAGGLLMVLMQ